MITHGEHETTITCDKCKHCQHAPNSEYNDVFFALGWVLHKGRKYEHLCYRCLSPKSRRAMDRFRDL